MATSDGIPPDAMKRHKVSAVIYWRASEDSPGAWAAKLTALGREKVLSGAINPSSALGAQIFVNRQVLSALKSPCSVDCYQMDGPLKNAIASQMRDPGLAALLATHSVQWYWWRQEPGDPAYGEMKLLAERRLRDFVNALPQGRQAHG